MKQIAMVRPDWTHRQHFLDTNYCNDITVLICQRKTKELIQLTLESLFRFYPDIPVIVVDGNSQDESTLYLRWKAVTNSNLQLVELANQTTNSHGVTMDWAIRTHVKTKYVLLMDSDLVIERPGFIEGMLQQLWNPVDRYVSHLSGASWTEPTMVYATGSLMLVSRANYACGAPANDSDILRYAHPSCSIYNVETYLTLPPFADHGAPCVYNMLQAEKQGLSIGYFPVDRYVSHLSGASWTEPRTIWNHDHDVPLRPFVTYITDHHIEILQRQTDHDFDVIPTGPVQHRCVILHSDLIKRQLKNNLYDLRFRVQGEYVCQLTSEVEHISETLTTLIKIQAITQQAPDIIAIGGLIIYRRNYWQNKICLQ